MAADLQPRFCKLSKKEGGSFGFFLRIEKDIEGHLIRSVVTGGPADKVGLRDGDRVIRVDTVFVDREEHQQVVELIKRSGNSVTLLVLDDVSYTQAKKESINLSELGGPSPTPSPVEPVMNGVSGQKPQPKLCHLVKQGSSFGFSLKTIEGVPGLFMTEITPDGTAFTAGVQPNDRIIELNGENVENINHQQMVSKMKASGNSIVLLLIDEASDKYFKSKMTKVVAAMASVKGLLHKPRIAELSKGPQGYGFYLRVEQGREGHYIREIDPKSPAEKAGLLDDDLLVAVNGNVIDGLDHEALVDKIRNCGNQITFLVVDSATNELYKQAGISPICYWQEVYESQPSAEIEESRESQRSADSPQHGPRTCHFTKGPDGYGFTLNAIKGVQGQFIKQVAKGSTAEEAGLKVNDIVMEVNGVNVEADTHEELVEKIKSSGVKLSMLVIAKEDYVHSKATNTPTSPTEIPEPPPEAVCTPESIEEESTPEEPVTQEPVSASPPQDRREQAKSSSSSSADQGTDDDTQL
ncbi:LOW QUALITY PROTEIN: Na(+)/H(+) exchange regulatory cofactor NHE-RF3 [Scyliorhinus canicula]|uniref:LOW QUALITY PROTEIN: Na(+)/H(+) exchange regulatory cofactor NHE-RF3 n=1 Tax=Scyliorhinus canicula TaxID=7830 RepID=UPI0018F33BDA|nr:LOW QUALITY PROTEIN: Na(+)/H(+) exchange regulatory cofactor NHE-RF3 [Scyliorhinus canicula]